MFNRARGSVGPSPYVTCSRGGYHFMSFSAPGSPPPVNPVPQPVPPTDGTAHLHQPGPYQPLPGFAAQPPAVLRSPQGVAMATNVLLALSGVLSLASAGISLYVSTIAGTGKYTGAISEQSITLPESLMALSTLGQLPLLLGTAVLFIIWFHRTYGNAEIFNPGAVTRSRGWAIGAWFIPIGNLFIPYKMAKEMWAASLQLRQDGSYWSVSQAPVTAWWLLWVAGLVSDRIFNSLYNAADTFESLADAAAASVVQGLLLAAAAVFAILFVRKLTALQTTKAAQGPYAAE